MPRQAARIILFGLAAILAACVGDYGLARSDGGAAADPRASALDDAGTPPMDAAAAIDAAATMDSATMDPAAKDSGATPGSGSMDAAAAIDAAATMDSATMDPAKDSGATPPTDAPCTPRACGPSECGIAFDGCQGVLRCGGCTGNTYCGADTPNRCGVAMTYLPADPFTKPTCPSGTRRLDDCPSSNINDRYPGVFCLDVDIPDSNFIRVGQMGCPPGFHDVHETYCQAQFVVHCVTDVP
jgi:hypothetical protein